MAKCVQGQDGKFSGKNKDIKNAAAKLLDKITTATSLTRKASGILTATEGKYEVRLDNQGEIEIKADDPRSTNRGGVAPVGRYHNLQLQVEKASIAGAFLDVSLAVNDNVVLNIKNAFNRSLADEHFYWVLPS